MDECSLKKQDPRFSFEIIGKWMSLFKNSKEDGEVLIFFDCVGAPHVFAFGVPPFLYTNRVVYILTPMQGKGKIFVVRRVCSYEHITLGSLSTYDLVLLQKC